MPTQNHIRLLPGNQKKPGIRLLAAHPVICRQFLQAEVGQISWMPVSMEVAGDGTVDSHVFEDLREFGNPFLSLIDSLNGVAPVPVRGHRLVAGKGWKPVAISEAQ